MNDSLTERMKSQYEDRYRIKLPRRTNAVIRIDGVHFHSTVKNCDKPYDVELMHAMDQMAIFLCENIMGAKIAYVQSDECSIIITDYDQITTQAWFDYNVQKMSSVAASMAAAKFNQFDLSHKIKDVAYFDARTFVIPDPIEVHNYLHNRQEDAVRNSIQMYGQTHFSSKQLHGVSCEKIKQMLIDEKNISWDIAPPGFKYGRVIHKINYEAEIHPKRPTHDKDGNPLPISLMPVLAERSKWVVDESYPVFKENIDYVLSKMPKSE